MILIYYVHSIGVYWVGHHHVPIDYHNVATECSLWHCRVHNIIFFNFKHQESIKKNRPDTTHGTNRLTSLSAYFLHAAALVRSANSMWTTPTKALQRVWHVLVLLLLNTTMHMTVNTLFGNIISSNGYKLFVVYIHIIIVCICSSLQA